MNAQTALDFGPPPETVEPVSDWLDRLRAELVALYEQRVRDWPVAYGPAYVTADDARKIQKRHPELRTPAGTSNNALGALFLTKGWQRIGEHRSTTKGARGNRIGRWAWSPPQS